MSWKLIVSLMFSWDEVHDIRPNDRCSVRDNTVYIDYRIKEYWEETYMTVYIYHLNSVEISPDENTRCRIEAYDDGRITIFVEVKDE